LKAWRMMWCGLGHSSRFRAMLSLSISCVSSFTCSRSIYHKEPHYQTPTMDQPDLLMIFCPSWKWRSEALSLAGQVGNGTRIRDQAMQSRKRTLHFLRAMLERSDG
jgi:hypothetical protein